jgi:hypothetical protein
MLRDSDTGARMNRAPFCPRYFRNRQGADSDALIAPVWGLVAPTISENSVTRLKEVSVISEVLLPLNRHSVHVVSPGA